MDFKADIEISSAQNPRVKRAVRLRDRRVREKEKRTLLEGYRELSRALEYGMRMEECFYCPSMFLGENEFTLLAELKSAGVTLYEVTDSILRKLAYRDRPEGLITIAEIREHSLDKLPFVPGGLYLVAEAVEKPGNLGSILRSADAAGADGVIVCDKCTDIYNPNVIRASTGALFTVPLAEAGNEETYEWLKKNKVRIFAATPHTDRIFSDTDMSGAVAHVVGTEQYGLTDFWLEKADEKIKIPMLGKIDSLNVATAVTILLYEAARQRGWKKIIVK